MPEPAKPSAFKAFLRGLEGAAFAGIPVALAWLLSWLTDQNQVERVMNNLHWLSPAAIAVVAPLISGLARALDYWRRQKNATT